MPFLSSSYLLLSTPNPNPNPHPSPNPSPLFLSLPPLASPSSKALLASAAKPPPRPRRRRSPPPPPVDAASTAGYDDDLEAEIYEFMRSSPKPGAFPTRAELLAADRADLAAAVASRGGWLAFGWSDDEAATPPNGAVSSSNGLAGGGGDGRVEQERHASGGGGVHPDYPPEASSSGRPPATAPTTTEERNPDYPPEAFSSARPPETAKEVVAGGGIEGILSRLERERVWSRSTRVAGGRGENGVLIAHNGPPAHHVTSGRDTLSVSEKGNIHNFVKLHSQNGTIESNNSSTSSTNDMWRTWTLNRGGFSDFEAAEIHPTDNRKLSEHDNLNVSSVENSQRLSKDIVINGSARNGRDSDRDQIRSRLQNLESVLTSALNSLRSRFDSVLSEKSNDSSANELSRLSDDWEFLETKVMHARDELRSIRAKIAVLEGKMALETIEKQKIIEEKQRRLDAAEKAMSLLRTVYIVWPNSASEVLLAGSFDGWTSRKKMERSEGSIFSLNLRLYPGRYEIKFIVDGTWKIDPLRPTVNNNSHENNLLIVP